MTPSASFGGTEVIETVSRLTQTLEHFETLETQYPEVLCVIKNALKADRIAFLLADEEGVFRFQAWIGLSEKYRTLVEGHSPWTSNSDAAPILIADVAKDLSLPGLRDIVLQEGIRALAFIPLVSRGRLLGKFMIYHDTPHHFSAEEVRLAETIAGVFSFAVLRKTVEDHMISQIQHQETILREVHHRVKNNLQMILSLLNLQGVNLDEKSNLMLRECQNRIRSMAMIHESLYKADDISMIDLGSYIQGLAESLLSSFGADDRIRLKIECVPTNIDTGKAVYCGLILNEILSNSLKHAFVGKGEGEIRLALQRKDNRFILKVEDNGVGIPEDAELHGSSTLGFRLISMLVQQLGGALHIKRHEGTAFQIEFT